MDDFSLMLHAFRQDRYRQTASRRVHTLEEALNFINEVGFCLFYRHNALELPNLRDATAGDRGTSEGLNWQWKDELASAQSVYYGRPFRRKPGFVAIPLLAPLYAVSPAADVGGDYHELALTGTLSAEAARIADTIQDTGSLSTRALRQESGLTASRDKTRFSRGLEEAQEKFLVAMVRTTSPSRAGYSYIWDTFERAWPDAAATGERLRPEDAAATLITRYVDTVGAATPAIFARIFSLDEELVEAAAAALVAQGTLTQVTRGQAAYLVSKALLTAEDVESASSSTKVMRNLTDLPHP
jgi:hypothetical protein